MRPGRKRGEKTLQQVTRSPKRPFIFPILRVDGQHFLSPSYQGKMAATGLGAAYREGLAYKQATLENGNQVLQWNLMNVGMPLFAKPEEIY